jgi:hypothetical protein
MKVNLQRVGGAVVHAAGVEACCDGCQHRGGRWSLGAAPEPWHADGAGMEAASLEKVSGILRSGRWRGQHGLGPSRRRAVDVGAPGEVAHHGRAQNKFI